MLTFSPWKIEQTQFDASQEADVNRQLAFSNGYISQYASFEELYSGEQASGTWLKGITSVLPPVNMLSVHLRDEWLDLGVWQTKSFYRCLNRQQPLLERRFTAVSPAGNELSVSAKRLLSTEDNRLLSIEYQLSSPNFSGPASFLALLGEPQSTTDWFPLERKFKDTTCTVTLQHFSEDIQVTVEMDFQLFKNDEKVIEPVIRVDKRFGCGFSITFPIENGDVITMKKNVRFSDSLTSNL